jgi:hypothetical protein
MRKILFLLLFLFPVLGFSQNYAMIELEERKVPEPLTRDTVVDKWNQAQPGYTKLSLEAKQLLYWTNYSRNNPEKFWNEVVTPVLKTFPSLNRSEAQTLKKDLMAKGSLPMFILNEKLLATAQGHASDIGGKHANPSHTSTNGTDFGSRLKKAGIKYCGNENISVSSQSVLLSVILLYLDIGLPDQGHRKTLLDPKLVEIGVGAAPYGKDGSFFLVQDFSCAQ